MIVQKLVVAIFMIFFSIPNLFAAEIEISKNAPQEIGFDSMITIIGAIEAGDSFQFQAIANSAKSNSIVVLSSNGGDLVAGLEIGRKIKEMGFATAVMDQCASSCALAWLAGAKMIMTEDAKVGFHLAYTEEGQIKESGQGNAIVGLYLGELGYRQNVVEYVTSAAPEDMQWLSSRDAKLLGINVHTYKSGKETQSSIDKPLTREDRAVYFVLEGIQEHTKSNSAAIRWVEKNYSSVVYYFEKDKSLNDIMLDKIKYFKRWPIRETYVDENSIHVKCENELCFVRGVYQWKVKSNKRNKETSGLAEFFYGVSMDDRMQIMGESGKVVSRN